jgi:hypothetical protein
MADMRTRCILVETFFDNCGYALAVPCQLRTHQKGDDMCPVTHVVPNEM